MPTGATGRKNRPKRCLSPRNRRGARGKTAESARCHVLYGVCGAAERVARTGVIVGRDGLNVMLCTGGKARVLTGNVLYVRHTGRKTLGCAVWGTSIFCGSSLPAARGVGGRTVGAGGKKYDGMSSFIRGQTTAKGLGVMLCTGYFGVCTGCATLLGGGGHAFARAKPPYPVLFMTLVPRKKHDPVRDRGTSLEKSKKRLYNEGKI